MLAKNDILIFAEWAFSESVMGVGLQALRYWNTWNVCKVIQKVCWWVENPSGHPMDPLKAVMEKSTYTVIQDSNQTGQGILTA